MSRLDIAAKAELALVLPSLVLANYLHVTGVLPDLVRSFHADKALDDGGSVVRLVSADGSVAIDEDVCPTLVAAAGEKNTLIKEWVVKSTELASKNRRDVEGQLTALESHLTLRTFIVGHTLTLADLAVWSALRANPVGQSLLRKTNGHTYRWYNFVPATASWLVPLIEELTAPAAKERAEDRAAASAAGASYDIDLPDLVGPITTRFPPEPSGYLHIGHAKAALLNDYFAHSRPGGKLICRFDDTNPSKESMEFQDSIVEDLVMLGIHVDTTSYSSDYFQHMYDLALQLIRDGKAFADDAELGKGDEDRKNRLPSKRRDMSINGTLARFADMTAGTDEGRRWCLRARIAYDSPNGTLRDPVIYRCNQTPHHRTGTSWNVYPTYDFCAPILDSLEGVTLALRTNEYRDRNVQYAWFQDALRLRRVPIYDFSRMNFVRTVLSKRKLTQIVADNKVWGWDDPRMPTVRGVLRRGVVVSALREFILKQGPSRNVLNLEWGIFWALNKKHIDPVAPRHTAIVAKDAVRCTVQGLDDSTLTPLVRPKYIKKPELGDKTVLLSSTIFLEQVDAQSFTTGEEITLMNWGNAIVRGIKKDTDGQTIKTLDLDFNPGGDVKKTKKITWLADTADNLVPVDLVSFDYLITKDKLDKDDNLRDCLTEVTELRQQAFADCNVKSLAKGDIIQFERKGYYKLDAVVQDSQERMVFFDIPVR
ncbi:glutamyl-tRNA synthetase [Sporothrix schenckii 1099-18]|uniref:glutamate--tRNA ligase n=2 Tax=Sporothrix schenckii TaxID=29908 RepID=U7PHN6_SPOS1|nr:glutamyl-tRNA synthetase [Sporothrix schenckii 1099-18]ERS95098.1 glutamate-tRNA ligase [Sporothrix schenckii ATCC 58251]KJR87287.1 glutamyl-tRNA synthetase [Sporothrix schenckii 1099-18]